MNEAERDLRPRNDVAAIVSTDEGINVGDEGLLLAQRLREIYLSNTNNQTAHKD